MNMELNEEQKSAMLATEGAVLVTAGAGSGKTRLLTQRIAYLIKEKNVDGFNILAITFTNKAAKEMKDRVNAIIGGNSMVWISTIHAMCAKILRRDIEKLNPKFNSNFTIYGTDDINKMLKKAVANGKEKLADSQDDKDDTFLKQVSYHMSTIKNANIPYDVYINQNQFIKDIEEIVEVIKRYQIMLEESNALDFDDLLVFTENLLKKDESVRSYYEKRFKYILVDEFQDTNIVQYNIIKLLAGKTKNVFVVGDEDQCIYGWRGANIKNINNFIKDYENCQIFKLEQNYRSVKKILDISNKLISKNTERIPKKLQANKTEDGLVLHRTFDNDKYEAEYVAQTIYELHEKGYSYSDFAILMRLNALSRNFEEKLLSYNIPHMVYGGLKFFDRLEVKNVISYLRILANPNDASSFLRIINYPKRGIGEITVDKILEASKNFNIPVLDMCGSIDMVDNISSATREKIKQFYNVLQDIRNDLDSKPVSEIIVCIINVMGIKDLYKEKGEENRNRLMNLDSLIQSAQEFEENNENNSIIAYLESVTLVNDADTEANGECVTIASVHAVKGLEFKIVFVVGVEQKVFPIVRDDTYEEEERRLMYVAITRAEERLYLTSAKSRFLYGHYEYMQPSTFLKEMGFISNNDDYYDRQEKQNTYGVNAYYDNDYYKDDREDKPKLKKIPFGKSLDDLNKDMKFKASKQNFKQGFEVGKTVNHSHYGLGKIIAVNGGGMDKMVVVQFDKVGKKELMLEYAPLTLID